MKKVIVENTVNDIHIDRLGKHATIFVKLADKFYGMIVKEPGGWIIKTGPESGATGHWDTRIQCMESGLGCGYTFHTDATELSLGGYNDRRK
jgi:hypothetical protein